MSFHDVLPADVKLYLVQQPVEESAPEHESEPEQLRAPEVVSEPGPLRVPKLVSEPSNAREPECMSEPILPGREPGQPAKWGFVCCECKHPVDEHLRGIHAPGCKNNRFNSSLLEGAEEFAHLL